MVTLIKAPISALKEWSALNKRFAALCAECIELKHISLNAQSELTSLLAGFTALQTAHGLTGPNNAQELLHGLSTHCTVEGECK